MPDTGVIAVTGPSGCGKTTLLRLIAGLEQPDSGKVSVFAGAKISMVFQEDRLLDYMSARGNILAVLPAGREQKSRSAKYADECLARAGLDGEAEQVVSEFSGGMRRRVAIARALAYGGDILIMDEPFKGLDAETRLQVERFVFERAEERLTVFVTHDENDLRRADALIRFEEFPRVVLERKAIQ